MGQSLVKNYLHITFSTKHQQPWIDSSIENLLYAYISGICKNLECIPIRVGGYLDHVHILCSLSKKIALMKLLEVVKANSSKWMKTNGDAYYDFRWQDGYAAFSVYPSDIDVVVRYIEKQREHHQRNSFEDELRYFLTRHNIEFDERYVWD
jgi:putative transposase